ncbi:hypothetical protein CMK14_12620 [Candidatus Poribacteria bacterium]|nr:hypothetical protein [Candidatus Poribacteria bacterium]
MYYQLSPRKECVFYIDDWKGYGEVCLKERHIRGKNTQFAWNKTTPTPDSDLEAWLAEAK